MQEPGMAVTKQQIKVRTTLVCLFSFILLTFNNIANAHELPRQPCVNNGVSINRDPHPFLPDENLELLALRISNGLYADKDIYERLVRDIKSIRAIDPQIQSVRYFPRQDYGIMIRFSASALVEFNEGTYQEWNCLNSFLGARVGGRLGHDSVELKLAGRYQLRIVLDWYQRLPGIAFAEADSLQGDSSNVYVTRQGQVWRYLFDIAGGDCPSGCTEHNFHYFETTKAGHVVRREAFDANSKGEAPDWALATFRKYT